jgi:hypothetical protein
MAAMKKLRVVLIKPSKYGISGHVERFRLGLMPNATLPHLASLTPASFEGVDIETLVIDEYVHSTLDYLDLLDARDLPTLVALVGVQSHQFHRALDVAAYALNRGPAMCVIGGPHVMTCDTSMLHHRGVSFALAEAEVVWPSILSDAIAGQLRPMYGEHQRWQQRLEPPVLRPPSRRELRRSASKMLGISPARGCPFNCNFCSVIKIAGRQIRSQPIETTMRSLHAAKKGGVQLVMFTSDNFNKYPEAPELLRAMIEEKIDLPFFVQCDAQIALQEDLLELLARAGCFQIFVGVESFSREALVGVRKLHNQPEHYAEIVRLCRKHRVSTHFSTILGFPSDTRQSVLEQLEAMKRLSPNQASFNVLTPVPGTEQYDDFLARGWITEKNLDRFDGSLLTWSHPTFGREELTDLLYHCFRDFYSVRHIVTSAFTHYGGRQSLSVLAGYLVFALFCRHAASRREHPLAGGIWRVNVDRLDDYIHLRRRRFGFDLLPLPASLAPGSVDLAVQEA